MPVADFALRHAFGTCLSAADVHPRTAMAALRPTHIRLTTDIHRCCAR
jgi:hypothetical protein